jgi:hypothetical protein
VHFLNSQSRQTMATVAALQMARIEKAAQGYITTYAATIEANATATNPATITVPMLVNTGYLPNGFQQNNPYGQTWEVQVLQPSAGQLQALVLSVGGNPAPTRDMGKAAQIAGASGGVIGGGSGDTAVPGCNGGEACGVYAGWKVSTSGYSAQPGNLAALIEYSNGQVKNDYLYRTAVPGQPQLNTMQTNLDMGNNNINNAQNVNVNQDVTLGNPGAAQGGSPAGFAGQLGVDEQAGQGFPGGWGGGIRTWDIYANGTVGTGENGSLNAYMNDFDGNSFGGGGQVGTASPNGANYAYMQSSNGGSSVVTNGTVQGGYVNSTGNVNAQYDSTASNAFVMDNGSWFVNNAGDSSQTGNAYVGGQVVANYDARLGTANGTASQNAGCSEYGEIAASANGNGQLLMCNGNSWQPTGGGLTYEGEWQIITGTDTSEYIGYYDICAITQYGTLGFDESGVYPAAGPYANGTYLWGFYSQGNNNIVVSCWDIG